MVYTKSSGNEGQFPCHGSRAIPHSTSYMTSGLNSLRQLQKFPETPISIIEEHQFLNINSRNAQCIPNHLEMKADSQVSTEEVCSFTQTPQEEAPHSNKYVRATLSLLPQWEWSPRCPDLTEDRISLQWLECRIIFHLTR